jgi:hypothetical protein
MQSAINIQPTFLGMLSSITIGHLIFSALELHSDETTTSTSQLEAHIQTATVEQFEESRDIFEQSAFRVADRGPRHIPNNSSPNADAEEELISTFTNTMRIIACPEVFVVDIEYILVNQTYFVCTQNVM